MKSAFEKLPTTYLVLLWPFLFIHVKSGDEKITFDFTLVRCRGLMKFLLEN